MKEADSVVFVIDDDSSVRDAIASLLKSVGLCVETFETVQQFLQSKRLEVPGCAVLDVRLPGLSDLDLQRELAAHDITLPIIFITGYGDIPMSVSAMKAGALEFLTSRFATRIFWTRSNKPLSATAQRGDTGWKPGSYASGLIL